MGTILHTVNQSPFDKPCLQQCLSQYREGDAIVLIGNGVYAALDSQPCKHACSDKVIYAIKADIERRGLLERSLNKSLHIIDMNDFVRMCTEYDLVQSWY